MMSTMMFMVIQWMMNRVYRQQTPSNGCTTEIGDNKVLHHSLQTIKTSKKRLMKIWQINSTQNFVEIQMYGLRFDIRDFEILF